MIAATAAVGALLLLLTAGVDPTDRDLDGWHRLLVTLGAGFLATALIAWMWAA